MNENLKMSLATMSAFLDDAPDFGGWLESQIELRWPGKSSRVVAREMGIAQSVLARWIQNTRPPNRRTVRAVAQSLDIDIRHVLIAAGYVTDVEIRADLEPILGGGSDILDLVNEVVRRIPLQGISKQDKNVATTMMILVRELVAPTY